MIQPPRSGFCLPLSLYLLCTPAVSPSRQPSASVPAWTFAVHQCPLPGVQAPSCHSGLSSEGTTIETLLTPQDEHNLHRCPIAHYHVSTYPLLFLELLSLCEIILFIYLFIDYWNTNTCQVLLVALDIAMNKTQRSPAFMECAFWCRETENK